LLLPLFICVLGISYLHISTIFLLNVGTVPTVWYIFFHFIIGYEKNPAELQLLKKIWLWSPSVIKIVKMKYNRIDIKWWHVSTSFKIYIEILCYLYITFTIFYYNTSSLKCISRLRSFITILFHSSVHFVPVLVKGLYQTESYSLHVMQLIRI
jgi:hypothetical protein